MQKPRTRVRLFEERKSNNEKKTQNKQNTTLNSAEKPVEGDERLAK
jgi:hypothetical protein